MAFSFNVKCKGQWSTSESGREWNVDCACCRGAVPKDYRVLPKRIILVRHAESEGNIDNFAYTYVPDPQVPLVSS